MEEAPPADARRGGQEEVNGGGAGRQDGHVEETADDLVAVGNGQYCRRSVLVQVQAMWEHPVAKNVPIHQLVSKPTFTAPCCHMLCHARLRFAACSCACFATNAPLDTTLAHTFLGLLRLLQEDENMLKCNFWP